MMETPKVFESEYKFCLILWENEPIKSGNLVKLCKERLGWKSTTTYTVIKRLSERGVIKQKGSICPKIRPLFRESRKRQKKQRKSYLLL